MATIHSKQIPLSDDRKFCFSCLLVYGLKECPKGTSSYTCFMQDTKSGDAILSSINESVLDQLIRDYFRLGRYTSGPNHPLLIHFNRSCDVVFILSKRRKLASLPSIGIKP